MRAVWVAFSILALVVASSPVHADEPACNAWDIEYELKSTLTIADTKMGGGDGTWITGPGRVVLRFANVDGAPGSSAKLLDYRERDKITLKPSTIVGSATITSDTITVGVPDACGVVAEGTLDAHALKWKAAWNVRSAGSIACNGSLCGVFGAPAPGTTKTATPPHGAAFKSFELSDDRRSFKMASSVVASQKEPRQTSYLALTGKETQRACVVAKACP